MDSFFLQKYIHDENNRIMIFTTISNLRRLAASRYWLVDGTFATVPLQCLSVQYQDLDAVVPLVFMLLSNKTQEIYTCAFEALLEIAQEAEINLHPRYVIADFEKAVVNVVKEIFPDAECYLCYFHFAQNLIKQLSFRGLKSMYSSDTNVYMAVKRLQALSFLPYPRISAAFESVKGHITQKLAGFLEYFSVTYVSGLNNNKRPTYHPALWSNYIAVKEKLPLTTNSLEAWHRRWTEVVGDNHLSITNIIIELRKEQKEIEGRILRITQGNIAQASQNYLDKIKAICLNVDNITNEDFIERVALLLSTKQKRV
ncbi:uncharacterized protein LOC5565157 [Aedes aegypti]|uniref:MULE transposase domain-containing protein n=1 Tax=Aedes aegypti TaxID=7159 RepID=A0A6I8U438_AEDAE|nr:uncharacterized protein LOC5565157 [Aedes aegypti]